MSSFKMHIAISKKIKEELNYTNMFLVGSILPDIIKLILGDRKASHFEENGIIDLNKFIDKQNNLESELFLGYYSHLIEDKIWYESYMTKKYLKLPEYSHYKLYSDYTLVDDIIYNELNIDTQNIGKILCETIKKINIKDISLMDSEIKHIINNENIKKKLSEVWKDYSTDGEIYFYNIDDAKEYYQVSIQKVKEYLMNSKKLIK